MKPTPGRSHMPAGREAGPPRAGLIHCTKAGDEAMPGHGGASAPVLSYATYDGPILSDMVRIGHTIVRMWSRFPAYGGIYWTARDRDAASSASIDGPGARLQPMAYGSDRCVALRPHAQTRRSGRDSYETAGLW